MSESNLNVEVTQVEDIGQFTFLKRNMFVEIKTKVERARLSEGVELDPFLAMFTEALADLRVMLVDPPKGWAPADLFALDPFDDASYERVLKVWSAIRGKEESFRSGGAPLPGGGEKAGGELPLLVPPDLQSDGERPALS